MTSIPCSHSYRVKSPPKRIPKSLGPVILLGFRVFRVYRVDRVYRVCRVYTLDRVYRVWGVGFRIQDLGYNL